MSGLPRILRACLAVGLLGCAFLVPARAEARPVVLLIHGGGWSSGSASEMDPFLPIAGEAGLEAVEVEYPLGNLRAANVAVRQVALGYRRQGRKVFAFGESAGGSMAALLAAQDRVDAAVANAPAPDLVTWGASTGQWSSKVPTDRKTRAEFSAYRVPNRNRVKVFSSPDDEVVPYADNVAYDQRFQKVSLAPITGPHLGSPVRYEVARRGFTWLRRQHR